MIKRISIAKRAYRRKDKALSKKAHTKEAIAKAIDHKESHQDAGKYMSDAVYGALDGVVTTLAVVSGVVGAELSVSIILILGTANLIADGFSMASGSYLSIKSERDYHRKEYEREKWEVENMPEGEIEEIRQIYKHKGFKGKALDNAVKTITKDKDLWIDTMMVEELGIIFENKSPFTAGLTTFVAFILCGVVPLIAFMLLYFYPGLEDNTFMISAVLAGITVFVVGSLRSHFIAMHWFRAGMEMLLIGSVAASVAYMIGYALKGIASM